MKFSNLLLHRKKPTLQEAYDKCLASGIEPHKINSAMMAIALEKIEYLQASNAELLEALEDICWKYRKAFNEDGYALVSFDAIKKGVVAIAKAKGEKA